MRDYSENEATSRDEMVCPNCLEHSVAKHPLADKQDSTRAKLKYGSRCTNDACELYDQPLPAEKVEEQLPDRSLLTILNPANGSPLVIIVLIIAALVGAHALGVVNILGPLQTSDATVTGTVLGPTGEPLADAIVHIDNTTVTTSANGTFTATGLTTGSATVYAEPPTGTSYGATRAYTIQVTENGATSDTANAPFTDGELRLQTPSLNPVHAEGWTADGYIPLEFANGVNAKDVTVTLTGNTTPRKTQSHISISAGETTRTTVGGNPENGTLRIHAPATTTPKTVTETYTGKTTFTIDGSTTPSDARFIFAGDLGHRNQSQTTMVNGTTTTTLTVDGSGTAPLSVDLSNGRGQATEHVSGTWTGSDPGFTIASQSAPATVNVTLTGDISTTKATTSGTVTEGEATFPVNGSIPATGATLSFNGGTPTETQVGDVDVTASGEGGETTKRVRLGTVASDGEYTLSTTLANIQNEKYITAGYQINNGNRVTVNSGDDSTTLTLNSGDAVYAWVNASHEATTTNSFDGSGSDIIDVESYSVTPTDINSGEKAYVTATVSNKGGEADNVDITLFVNGQSAKTQSVSVAAGETKTVDLASLPFDEKGIHTVSVNDKEDTVVSVDGATLTYGEATLNATLSRQAGNGEVSVDTDGDGTMECSGSVDTTTCQLGSISAGQQSISVEEEGVTDSQFTVSYTAREGARNVTLDVDDDGEVDASHEGFLQEGDQLTARATLDAGNQSVSIESATGGPIEYDVSWRQAGVIDSPTIRIDGETVVNSTETYRGDTTFDLGSLEPGEHTVSLDAASGTYDARFQWSEYSEDAYPTVRVNGRTVCSPEDIAGVDPPKCVLTRGDLQTGSNTLSMANADGAEYSLKYTARVSASAVTATVGDSENTFRVSRADAQTVHSNGTWVYEGRVDGLAQGENVVSVEQAGAEIAPNASATLSYTSVKAGAVKPRVVVTNPYNGTFSKSVPAGELTEAGALDGSATVALPQKWFASGVNQVRVETENGVRVYVNVSARSSVEQSPSVRDD